MLLGGTKVTGTGWTIPMSGFQPGTTHTGAVKACVTGTTICSTWDTVTINKSGTIPVSSSSSHSTETTPPTTSQYPLCDSPDIKA